MSKWATVLTCLLSWEVQAAGPNPASPIPQDVSTERYANDLVGGDAIERQFAARVLRRRVRSAWRIAGRPGDSIPVIEARQTLANFDLMVAPRCTRQLSERNVLRACAQILGMLETEEALTALHQAAQSATTRRDKRVIDTAIRQIKAEQ